MLEVLGHFALALAHFGSSKFTIEQDLALLGRPTGHLSWREMHLQAPGNSQTPYPIGTKYCDLSTQKLEIGYPLRYKGGYLYKSPYAEALALYSCDQYNNIPDCIGKQEYKIG